MRKVVECLVYMYDVYSDTNANAPRNYVNCPFYGTFSNVKFTLHPLLPPVRIADNSYYRMLYSTLHKSTPGVVMDFRHFAQSNRCCSTHNPQPPNTQYFFLPFIQPNFPLNLHLNFQPYSLPSPNIL